MPPAYSIAPNPKRLSGTAPARPDFDKIRCWTLQNQLKKIAALYKGIVLYFTHQNIFAVYFLGCVKTLYTS